MIYVYEMLMKDIHVHCISCCCLTLFWHFFAAYSLCFHLILIMKCWWKMNILQVRVVQPISDIFFCIYILCFYEKCIYCSLWLVFYVSLVFPWYLSIKIMIFSCCFTNRYLMKSLKIPTWSSVSVCRRTTDNDL